MRMTGDIWICPTPVAGHDVFLLFFKHVLGFILAGFTKQERMVLLLLLLLLSLLFCTSLNWIDHDPSLMCYHYPSFIFHSLSL